MPPAVQCQHNQAAGNPNCQREIMKLTKAVYSVFAVINGQTVFVDDSSTEYIIDDNIAKREIADCYPHNRITIGDLPIDWEVFVDRATVNEMAFSEDHWIVNVTVGD